jgi:Flp pilus assembly protein TadG
MAIVVGLSLTVILVLGALAIDLTYVRTTQFELINATDAAAHAALLELRHGSSEDEARDMAITIGSLNKVAGTPATIRGEDVVFGFYDWGDSTFTANGTPVNSVQVNTARDSASVDGPLKLWLGSMYGTASVGVSESAIGAFRTREVVIAQDVTTSFVDEMDDARAADVAFLDYMHTANLPDDRIGLQTFTGAAYEFTDLMDVDTNYSTIRTKWHGDGLSTKSSSKTSGITICYEYCYTTYYYVNGKRYSSKTCLKGSWMQACGSGTSSNTSPGRGIYAAAQELINNAAEGSFKAIILVSDGAPTTGGTETSTWRKALGVSMADYADANDISIYTVFMDTANSSTNQAYMASLVRGNGSAYTTTDSDELVKILTDIAESLPVALVE